MKRLFTLLLALVLALGGLCLPAEAASSQKVVKEQIIKQPTCEKPGIKRQYDSNGTSKDVEIPALGHKWSKKTYTRKPDCTNQGVYSRTCSRCGKKGTWREKALGHDWGKQVLTKKADCTHEGVYTSTCTRCKQQKTVKTVKALGHDWDEGVITSEPQGFTPGEKLFTCKRDPKHTRTEQVDPTELLFATLEGGFKLPDFDRSTFELSDIPVPVIVEQPKGGYVAPDSDEGLVMSVKAEGGEPPYTYEWYRTAQDEETLEKAKDFVVMMAKLFGMSEEETQAKLADVTLESAGELVGEEQEFHATEGDFGYFCVVSDSIGQKAISDVAKAKSAISIWTEPSNTNLMDKESVTLSCMATGGSGEYGYTWYRFSEDAEDTELGSGTLATEGFNAGKLNEFTVDDCGEYYCVADDRVTGHTAASRTATVYAAPQLRIAIDYATETQKPGVSYELLALVSGGVPPYQVWWEYGGLVIPSKETDDDEGILTAAESVEAGMYTVYAEDEVGNFTCQTITRSDPPLRIAKQPEGGTIQLYGNEMISVAVTDGEAPYNYVLYRNNGETYAEATLDDPEASFEVFDAGSYYFRVEDTNGRSCRSKTAVFEMAKITITHWTPEAEITRRDKPAKLKVEAEGGTEPYFYMWIRIIDGAWYLIGQNSQEASVTVPGEYFCIVADEEGYAAYSNVMTVTYTGGGPLIVEQPTGGALDDDGSFTLTCKAVSSSGGELRYEWEKSAIGARPNWKPVSRSGGSSRSRSVRESAAYRCKVTDIKTGEYVYTNQVLVKQNEKISVKIEKTGRGGQNGEYGQYRYIITGGIAPYKVECYLVSSYLSATENKWIDLEVLWWSSSDITEEWATNEFNLDMYYDFVYWDPNEQINKKNWQYAKYYLVVSDVNGDPKTTDLIDVYHDYKDGEQ
ncbi:MAG: immunoglobulin domain-containing protein [Clostridiales bacterium]|nr:immunoglobulin domain-containing protein [Clostridiales bacterium]